MIQRRLPFVWELEYNGVVSHLVGTLHYAPKVFSRAAKKLLANKKTLLVECVGSSKPFLDKVRPSRVFALFTAEEQEELAKRLERPISRIRDLNYSRVENILFGQALKESNLPFEPIDTGLFERAINDGLNVLGLESPNEQKKFIMENAEHDAFRTLYVIREELKSPGFIKKVYHNILRAYMRGDAAELLAARREVEIDYIDSTWRNKNMVKRSLPYLGCSKSVVVVGASHLIEGETMIDMYREKGSRVARV